MVKRLVLWLAQRQWLPLRWRVSMLIRLGWSGDDKPTVDEPMP